MLLQHFDELNRLLTQADAIANLLRTNEADPESITGASWALADLLGDARDLLQEAWSNQNVQTP